MNVVEEKENKLFERKEVVAEFDSHGGTMSRKQVLEELKKKFHGEVVIEKIEQKFGMKSVTVKARVYASAEKAGSFEPEWRKQRGFAAPKAGEAKA
ncbi:30S ribosomal protein S24e [Candidatus Micrarchaeota archaeon]|nr:30S ribosomal protein S24e [Candidatus Micrarchaeota archaeon]